MPTEYFQNNRLRPLQQQYSRSLFAASLGWLAVRRFTRVILYTIYKSSTSVANEMNDCINEEIQTMISIRAIYFKTS